MINKKSTKFIERIFSPTRSLLLFVVATATLTMIIQVVYDYAKKFYGLVGVAVLVVILVIVLLIVYQIELRGLRQRKKSPPFQGKKKIKPHKGLIVLVSPGGDIDLVQKAITPHTSKNTLRHLWLIYTSGKSEDVADKVKNWVEAKWHKKVTVYLDENYLVNPENVTSTYDVVQRIYSTEISALGLAVVDIVADITGGKKPMSAGMALACEDAGGVMQYVFAPTDPKTGQRQEDEKGFPVLISRKRQKIQ